MNQYPAGLAALTASPYADSDVMNVRMTPREVAGLQQLAMSYGANEQDLYDPMTGQPRFSFLKKILPMIAGAILPGIPGVGTFAKTIGFGSQALGTSLLVGGITGLIEGDLKKGLMAGLGAYSGAKIGEAFTAAGTPAPAPTAPATEIAPTPKLPGTPSLKESILGGPTPRTFDTSGAATWSAGQPGQTPVTQAVQAATTVKPPPTGFFGTMGQGVKNVFASGDVGDTSRSAFLKTFENPLVRSATLMGGLASITPDQKPLSVPGMGEDIMYIPGGPNPLYGTGADQPPQLPGQYYKRTAKGLVPYNPFQKAPGYATGGPVQPADQNMQQPRAIPHPYQSLPNANQNYPLSTVMHANYQSNVPQPRELLSGYGPKMDPYTGEEKFADGGPVVGGAMVIPGVKDGVEGYYTDTTRTNFVPYPKGSQTATTPAANNPFAAGAAGILPGATQAGDAAQATTTTEDPNVAANRAYVAELNRRAMNPSFTPYGAFTGAGGIGGTNTPWTGTNPYGGPLTPPTGGDGGAAGGGAGDVAAFLATQVGVNWLMQPGNAAALQKWITGGMKWAERPFLNADKTVTPPGGTTTPPGGTTTTPGGTNTTTGGETGGQQTQTGGETGGQQTTTGGESQPYYDPLKNIVVAGGTGAAAVAAAQALAAKIAGTTKMATVGIQLVDGSIIPVSSSAITGGAAGAGAAGAGTGAATGATGAATGATGAGAGTTTAGGASTTGGIGGAGFPGGAAGAGLAALLGAQQAYKGISQGKEGQAALGGALAGAGTAAFLGGTAPAVLGGANLATLAGFGPVGLAAAAIAAIGASLVNTKEYGDVALRNYWNAVDQGRGLGAAPPEELAQGFINFYRTNKNEFAGQAKYGRTGNEDFIYDMTQVINNAVKDGKVSKDVDAATMYKQVVQPWLNSMGEGPKNEDAKRIQDFMMTDLINNFMRGAPISNAQVKGDKKYKIVSEKPVYAGTPTDALQRGEMGGMYGQMPIGFQGRPGGIPAGVNPYADTGRESIMPPPDFSGVDAGLIPEEPPPDPMRGVSLGDDRAGIMPTGDGEIIAPMNPDDYIVHETLRPSDYMDNRESIMPVEETVPLYEPYNPYAEERAMYRPDSGRYMFAAGGAIGDDYNFGFRRGGMPEYLAGGKLLKGPGDGMSDSIPAVIRGRGVQRAALADGEFVIPADVVSHLGNGSTNAGAKKLYGMMDKIRQARTGRTRQAPAVKTDRYLPA